MKKRILFVGLFISVLMCINTSCTKQSLTREFGGTMTIELPKGQELMEATWKEDNLFYLTRPMSEDYVPVTKTFQESSSWGVMESTVLFVESK